MPTHESEINMNDQFIQKIDIDWSKISTNSYLKKINSIKNMNTLIFNKPITFFVGENGSGKSTLLEALAVEYGFNPEGGTKNYHFSTYDSHSELCNAIRITKGICRPKCGYFLRAESFYNVATKEEEYADIAHPSEKYHERSHGESFLTIAQNYMRYDGIYIFDEPEAALSPQRQLTLLIDIYMCSKKGSQFIIATHSIISSFAYPVLSRISLNKFLTSALISSTVLKLRPLNLISISVIVNLNCSLFSISFFSI